MDPEPKPLTASTKQLIDRAIEEDQVLDDVTTNHLVDPELRGTASIVAKEPGVLAGPFLVDELFDRLPGETRMDAENDGTHFTKGETLLHLDGPVRTLLAGERLALNVLQHLSGIASRTDRFVRAVEGLDAAILDTRKTTPGWRGPEKYAVRVGGGQNHRMHLAEMAMVKENHLASLRRQDRDLHETIRDLKQDVRVQIEVSSLEELDHVLSCEPDLILLDNLSPDRTRRAVDQIRSRNDALPIEASGGIDLDDVRDYAKTGVDRISIGSLTHSAPAVDLSMRLEEA